MHKKAVNSRYDPRTNSDHFVERIFYALFPQTWIRKVESLLRSSNSSIIRVKKNGAPAAKTLLKS